MAEPYRFYPCARSCPRCGAGLVTATPLTLRFTYGMLHELGVTCYCVQCNHRYRATHWLRFSFIAWAGPIGRWIWWKTARLETTLTPPDSFEGDERF